ncbi:MAG: tRNA pseudouridine(55) synthase TruB [Actinobacteria bacterium]|nr:tRNA pseudouridine(55) synthase TruB [Actinomycetota bacterium]NCW72193.1 tRNA pseudouridine(55) synthase TruB [Actinomycetota bacterium]NCX38025.1 tRNA pseudouridine(55) synthase TruB [Actinomycetota bacterium]NCX39323.1 tRNA pseudouridine(55) synthase TruB [Actinomycetota bacterium]NCX52521.1 tRNA pseudouridine(55) synthase TruB [Actinomycetota bacterium]
MEHGFLVVDKEPGMTSHDVVAIARRALGTRKVGHAGTLDPMATGILVLGFNNGTRLLQYITNGDKTYEATVVLGAATVTDDVEGEVISRADVSAVTDEQIEAEMAKMRGTIMQRPSSVSAVKVDGERAYNRVRAGERVELAAREVTISQLDIKEVRRIENVIEVDIEVMCSAGTFIRAIARDCGNALAVGGHLNSLRRTRVAGFGLDKSISLTALKAGEFSTLGLVDVARTTFSTRELEPNEINELSFGRPLSANPDEAIYAAIFGQDLVALLCNKDGLAKPIAVFAAAN